MKARRLFCKTVARLSREGIKLIRLDLLDGCAFLIAAFERISYSSSRLIFRPKSSIIGRKGNEIGRKEGCCMRTFDYTQLAERSWPTDIVNFVAKIHECKGRQDLFVRQKPTELDRLVEIAKIQSTEASNKIEGIVTTSTRMKQLLPRRQRREAATRTRS